ncbi:MAG: hypothetical protein RSD74_03405 [Angelakisella sp.]
MKKRIVSLLLALAVAGSMLSSTALAEDGGTTTGGTLTALTQTEVDGVFGSGNASFAPGATSITLNKDITMTGDITLGVDCTLDLGGHTLKSQYISGNAEPPILFIGDNKTVAIVSNGGEGSVIGDVNGAGLGRCTIISNGALTIGEDVTVEGADAMWGSSDGGIAIEACGTALTVQGTVRGGDGGNGGDGGSGGEGGKGILARQEAPPIAIHITTKGIVYGGRGGNNSNTSESGAIGGNAVHVEGASATITLEGSLVGGIGGDGSQGGTACFLSNTDSKLVIKGGSLVGGDGGRSYSTGGNGGVALWSTRTPADTTKITAVQIEHGAIQGGDGSGDTDGGTHTGGNGGTAVYADGCTIKVTTFESEISGGNGGHGVTPGVDGKVSVGDVRIGEADLNVPEDTSHAPSENEANTPATLEKLSASKGDSVAVKLVSGSADISVSTINALSEVGKDTSLRLTVSDGLAGGTAEIVIPGGFGKVTEAGRFSYPMNYRNKAEDHDTMVKAVKGSGSDGITYTMRVGANMTLPTAATITTKTPVANGTGVNIYKYNEHANRFVLLGKATAKDGRLTFSTKELGQMLLTTGTV